MAKWGEGDPRWLVEERPDATNVNNWHWTEKNAAQWSKEKFNELFIGAKIETDFAKCEITEISKCKGDAVVNNRKAKLIFFYEWIIEMKWKGALVNSDNEVKGTIRVPNLSEEFEMKDIDVHILLDSTGPEAEILKDMMRLNGVDIVKKKLSIYINSLTEEFSKGLILPTKDSNKTEAAQTTQLNKKTDALGSSVIKSVKNSTVVGNIETIDLTGTEIFKCTAEEFYRYMTDPEMVKACIEGIKVFEPKVGGRFELFDGNVQGSFVKLEPFKTIVQKWRYKSWPEGHFSEVVIDIEEKTDCTEVHVSQSGIPKAELENTAQGWRRYYWDHMRRKLGFGAYLF